MHQRLTMICEEIDTELWTQQRLNDRIQKIEQQQRDLKTQAEKFKESKERVCKQIHVNPDELFLIECQLI